MKLLFCIVLVVALAEGYAQEPYQPTKIIPPSPTAASLGIYGDVPVSTYTGTANVAIPLYTIKTNQHSVPVTLNYNCSAIKVAQDAGWVGLGWSLSAGGVITRTIRGNDDFSSGGYWATGKLPPYDENNDHIPNYYDEDSALLNREYFRDVLSRTYDGEPDIFFYNFAGYSGKFLIGKNVDGNPTFMSDRNDLEIKFDPDFAEGGWTIITPNGFEYLFTVPEFSENCYKSSELSTYAGLEPSFIRTYQESISSWYLSLIKSPAGEEIAFTYETGMSLSLISSSQTRYDRTSNTSTYGEGASTQAKYSYFDLSRQIIKDVILKKIEFNNGYVIFNTSRRSDIEPVPTYTPKPQKLSSIEIYNTDDELQKKFLFKYNYFNNSYSSSDSFSFKRLMLDTLIEYGKSGSAHNPYLFKYFDVDYMPSKYSRQVDDWGHYSSFYTPVLTGELYPTLLPIVTTDTHIGVQTFDGTKRESDSIGTYSKKGILTSITYPTTGITEFEYEPNEYRVAPYLTTGNQITYATAFSYYINPYEDQLISNFNVYGTDSVSFSLTAYPLWDSIISPSQNVAYLKNIITGDTIESFSIDDPNKIIVLPTGNYAVVVDAVYDYSVNLTAFHQNPPIMKYSRKGAGIRIKSTINYNYDHTRISAKNYLYTMNGPTGGLSTGQILFMPPKSYKTGVVVVYPDPEGLAFASAEYLVRSSHSLYAMGFNSEQTQVTYDKVWESASENGEGGYTAYSYINLVSSAAERPEIPVPSFSLNGKLKSIETRNAAGEKLTKKINDYTLKESFILKGVKILKTRPDNSPHFAYADGEVKYYDNVSQWWVLSSEIDSSFFGNQTVVTTKQYYFLDSIYKQKTKEEMTQSDGSSHSIIYKYPQDFVSTSPYDSMVIAKHIISPVIEQISYRDTAKLESVRTNYYNWSGYYAPTTVESKRGWGTWKTRLRFHGYDDKGNLLSISKENDAKSSYIWGYNKTLPFIKAENITSTDLTTKVDLALKDIGYTGGINDIDEFLTWLGNLSFSSQKTAWKSFNTYLRNRLLTDNVDYSVYTYVPLIGMTSVTNANNLTTYYEFDNFGRLKTTKDNDGNTIKVNKYNYRQ